MNNSTFVRSKNALWVACLIFIYGLLVFFGVSSSSLSNLSEDGKTKPGIHLNAPQAVRSDEFLRSTPLILADLNGGSGVSALDAQNSIEATNVSEGLPSKALTWSSPRYLLERIAKHVLDSDQAFAAIWWFPVFVLLVFMPLFLKKIGVSTQISLITTFLILLSTSASWWSLWPLAVLAWPVAGAYLAVVGLELIVKRSGRIATAKGLVCLIVSLAFLLLSAFEYAPWSLLVNAFILAITIGYLVEDKNIVSVGRNYFLGFVASLLALLVGKVILFQSSISIALATVYPGARRSLEGGSSLSLFSGDLSWALQKQAPTISNQSELAVSHIELLVISLAFVPFIIVFRSILGRNLALVLGSLVLIPFFLWTIAPWPNALSDSNPLRFIPPDRVLQIFGIPSIIVFGIFANVFRRSHINDVVTEIRLKRGLLALVLIPVLLLILDSNKAFASLFAPEVVPPKYIWGCAIGIVVAIYFALTIRNVLFAFAPLLILSLFNVFWVNPIVVGLGDLQNSGSAKLIQNLDKENGQLWASDSFWVDTLLMSNGTELASGQQGSGPNMASYKLLDPLGESINSWNRGASYVSFIWLDSGEVEISSPSADQIRIAIDPCSSEVSSLEIKWIVSSRPLSNDCSTFRGDVIWMGTTFYIYERI